MNFVTFTSHHWNLGIKPLSASLLLNPNWSPMWTCIIFHIEVTTNRWYGSESSYPGWSFSDSWYFKILFQHINWSRESDIWCTLLHKTIFDQRLLKVNTSVNKINRLHELREKLSIVIFWYSDLHPLANLPKLQRAFDRYAFRHQIVDEEIQKCFAGFLSSNYFEINCG